MTVLDRINSPEDLKKLNIEEMKSLAGDIRDGILTRVNALGGHLGPDLGIVEVTIAMHYVFNSPVDKFVFDVSHQVYPHKMITGRKRGFLNPLENFEITGYSNPKESAHDNFVIGHTSTSVSLATGLAKARDLKGEKYNVVALIGDGSLSGGQAFEGFNNAAMLDSNMIVIVNDNNMSISKNIGFIAKRYNSLRINKSLSIFRKITPIRIKHALQYYAYRVDLFTSLGFKYFENIDGHDFKELITYLELAKLITMLPPIFLFFINIKQARAINIKTSSSPNLVIFLKNISIKFDFIEFTKLYILK